MAKKLSLRQVKAILQGEKADSLSSAAASKLSNDRTTNLNYYLGQMDDMPVAEGRSKVISTDVADTIGGLMPPLMDIFCGADEVAKFDPVGPEDVPAAQQETQYVNNVLMQKNPGYSIIYSMIFDALLSKTGTVKVWWEEKEEEEEETYLNQDEEAFVLLATKPDYEMAAHTANEDGTHDVTIVKRKGYGCAKVVNVPPEEFGVSRRTRRIQDTPYCFHEPGGGRPESELIAEGYDPDQVKKLSTWSEARARGTEAMARDSVDENATQGSGDSLSRGQRPVQITEHYVVFDYEGKGKASRYRIVTGGDEGEVLYKNGKPDIEKIDYLPFAVAHSIPLPHRFFGRCPADIVVESQRVKTALSRGMMDNIYLINNQQIEVSESHASDSTIDDLLNRRIGGIVRTKQPGGITPVIVQPIADKLYPALEYHDREREWRTGVTREGQGLDAEALQNQSATAARQLHSASQAKMKLIARNLAEGVRDLFWLLHCVIRKHGSKPETVRLLNEWVTVDPRSWRARDDLTIAVGLGSGGKQEQLAGTQLLIQAQMQAAQDPRLGLVDPKKFYNAAKDLCKLLDKRDPTLYFNDPGDAPMPEPPPPPELQKAQMEAQSKQQEIHMKAGIEKLQAEADIATNQKKLEAEMAREERKAQLEMQMQREEHAMKMQELRMKLISQAASTTMKAQTTQSTDGEGNPQPTPQPDFGEVMQNMAAIDAMMANGSQAAPSGPKTKRMKKVGPGEWIVEG